MNFPSNLKYTKSHEWVKDLGNGLFEIGISDYAQGELGDLVYINLPKPGDELKAGKPFGDVESVKAVSEVYSPVTGTVKEVNDEVVSSPEKVNKEPYEAWFVRVEGALEAELLTAEDYEKTLK